MKVIIDYSDGLYSYRPAEAGEAADPRAVDVPDEVVALWDAAAELSRVVQRQLRELDP